MAGALAVQRASRASKHHLNVVSTVGQRLNLYLSSVQVIRCSYGTEKFIRIEIVLKWFVGNFIPFCLLACGAVFISFKFFFHVLPSMSSLELWRRNSMIFCYEIIRSLDVFFFHLWHCRFYVRKLSRLLPDIFLMLILLETLPAWESLPPAERGVSFSNLSILRPAGWDFDWFLVFGVGCNYETRTNLINGRSGYCIGHSL